MHFFDNQDICEIIPIDNNEQFCEFVNSCSADIAFIPEPYLEYKGLIMNVDAGNFAKWLRKTKPELRIDHSRSDGKLILRSSDLWLPLVFLASNVALPVYLNLVSSYIFERMRGALRGEKQRVHFDVIYEDKHDGITKKLHFEGDNEALEKTIKRLDLNKFLDK